MKPEINKLKEIRRAKYRLHWYKAKITMMRNLGIKDYKDDQSISMS